MGAVTVGAASDAAGTVWKRPAQGVMVEGLRVKRVVLTASASYATGGDTFTPAQVGLDRVFEVLVEATLSRLQNLPGRGVGFNCSNPLAPKMQVYTGLNTEAANASNQSNDAVVAAWVIGL